MPGDAGVVAHDVGVAVTGRDVIVELAAAARHPASHVGAELDPPERRVVAQQAVAFAGHHERHHMLAVALVQVDHAALQVEAAGGVQPHAVKPLPRPRGEGDARCSTAPPRRPRCAAGRCACPDRGSRPRSRAPPGSAPARSRRPPSPPGWRKNSRLAVARPGARSVSRAEILPLRTVACVSSTVTSAALPPATGSVSAHAVSRIRGPTVTPHAQAVRPPRYDRKEFHLPLGEGAGSPWPAGVQQAAARARNPFPYRRHRAPESLPARAVSTTRSGRLTCPLSLVPV